MNNENNDSRNKIQEYNERYRFWVDKRVAQLSFHNNLLLTVGIAIIGYFWKERNSVYRHILIDSSLPVDGTVVLFCLGITAATFSIIFGFILSMSRLYDLRLTANILLTKKRLAAKNIDLQENQQSEPSFLSSMQSLMSVFWCYSHYKITKNHIADDQKELESRFNRLRQKSSDLGYATWALLKVQTLCALVSVVVLVVVLIIK